METISERQAGSLLLQNKLNRQNLAHHEQGIPKRIKTSVFHLEGEVGLQRALEIETHEEN